MQLRDGGNHVHYSQWVFPRKQRNPRLILQSKPEIHFTQRLVQSLSNCCLLEPIILPFLLFSKMSHGSLMCGLHSGDFVRHHLLSGGFRITGIRELQGPASYLRRSVQRRKIYSDWGLLVSPSLHGLNRSHRKSPLEGNYCVSLLTLILWGLGIQTQAQRKIKGIYLNLAPRKRERK